MEKEINPRDLDHYEYKQLYGHITKEKDNPQKPIGKESDKPKQDLDYYEYKHRA